MLNNFKNYIQKNALCDKSDKILIAVSGGADSVVLLHLFIEAGCSVALAHCNFNLRGTESDDDEIFVKNLCVKYNIQNHFTKFNTREYAAENKISIEMAARDLRYNWFEQLCREYGYSKIATGHHLNDSIETVFLNLARGTGINGLTGISAKNGKIFRPLLFATSQDILDYAHTEKLEFRHDSSNDSNEYLRNVVRHNIIPTFKTLNPAFEQVMSRNISNITQAALIYNEAIKGMLSKVVENEEELMKISINKLLQSDFIDTLLFELLSPLGFTIDTVSNLIVAIDKEPGRMFYSESHQLLVDRDFVFIEPIKPSTDSYVVETLEEFHKLPFNMEALLISGENYLINHSNTVANLDADKIQFPITIRHWNTGDRFFPLGMKQSKKISDFFTDLKIDRLTKDKIWILESNKEIVWLMGYRIDNRFKVTPKTKKVLLLKVQ